MNALNLFRRVVFPHLWLDFNWIGGAIAAIGSIGGALLSSNSASDAASSANQASVQGAKRAKAEIDASLTNVQDRLDPYTQYGEQSLNKLLGMNVPKAPKLRKFSFDADDLYDDPSYQFRLEQGQQALDRLAGKNRGLLSGGRLVDAMNYNQGFASTEYQNAWQRALAQNTTNNQVRQAKFGNRMTRFDANQNKWKTGLNVGVGADSRLADYDYRSGVDKGNLWQGLAANSVAADMFAGQAQANAWNTVGQTAGYLGGQYMANQQPSYVPPSTAPTQQYPDGGSKPWNSWFTGPNKIDSWSNNWMTPGT